MCSTSENQPRHSTAVPCYPNHHPPSRSALTGFLTSFMACKPLPGRSPRNRSTETCPWPNMDLHPPSPWLHNLTLQRLSVSGCVRCLHVTQPSLRPSWRSLSQTGGPQSRQFVPCHASATLCGRLILYNQPSSCTPMCSSCLRLRWETVTRAVMR